MIRILSNGKDKVFEAHCVTCGSDLEYQHEDVQKDNDEEFKMRYIVCPVCGEKLVALMETKEDRDLWKARVLSGFATSCFCKNA